MMGLDLSVSALATALGSAVLHFLWQGAAIGVLAALTLALIDKSKVSTRYWLSCVALAACALAFLATLGYALVPASIASGATLPLSTDPTPETLLATSPEGSTVPHQVVQGIAWLWIAGVVVLQLRLALQCAITRRLGRHAVSNPTARWIETFESLKHDLGIGPKVRLLRSAAAEVPMVVGWLSPVVLVPVSAFASLTPEQLRAVLVHELAHIRRHDHVLNAIQIFVETALFFHPVTWWLSNQIRTERENCCDDAAVRSSAHPRIFAEALARLETIRSASPQAALAATGGPLMSRIARIIGTTRPSNHRAPAWRTTLAIVAGTVVAATGVAHALSIEDGTQDEKTLEVLRQYAIVAGADDDRLRDLYDKLIFDGSETQRAFDIHLDKLYAELDMAADAGKVSREEVDKRLEAARHEMDVKRNYMFATDVLGYTKGEAHLFVTRQQIGEAVAAGRLTRQEAHVKMVEAQARVQLHTQIAAEAANFGKSVSDAVQAGVITPEEAHKKLAEFHERHQAKLKIDAMVATGEITRAQAEEKLAAVHHQAAIDLEKRAAELAEVRALLDALATRNDRASTQVEQLHADLEHRYVILGEHEAAIESHQRANELADVKAEIAEALERGTITAEEAKKKLAELTRRMEHIASQKAELEARKRDAEWAAIRALVERGETVKAEHAYLELSRRLAQLETEPESRDRVEAKQRTVEHQYRFLLEQLAAVQADIDAAVASGNMTRDAAKKAYQQYLDKLATTDAQNRDKAEAERRAVENRDRIAAHLAEAGIPRDKLREAVGALERIAHEMKEEGKDFELNARLRVWLEDQGFTNENIATLIDLARRRVGGAR